LTPPHTSCALAHDVAMAHLAFQHGGLSPTKQWVMLTLVSGSPFPRDAAATLHLYVPFHDSPMLATRCSASALRRRLLLWPTCVFLTDSIVRCYLRFTDAHHSVLYLYCSPPPTLIAGGPLVAIGLSPAPVSIFVVSCAIAAVAVANVCLHHRSIRSVSSRVRPCPLLLIGGALAPVAVGAAHLPRQWSGSCLPLQLVLTMVVHRLRWSINMCMLGQLKNLRAWWALFP
jgi:hypothetical protein